MDRNNIQTIFNNFVVTYVIFAVVSSRSTHYCFVYLGFCNCTSTLYVSKQLNYP